MTTARKIIERAFSKAGIRASETPLQASELEDGLDVLNDLLSTWNANGTLTGVDLISDASAEVKIPREALWALKANVAVILAGEYGVEISQSMAFDASNSLSEWVKASVDLRFLKMPSTLPIGSGNQDQFGISYDRDFFPEDAKDNF